MTFKNLTQKSCLKQKQIQILLIRFITQKFNI